MRFSGAPIVRLTSQGLGVETDLSAPRVGDLAPGVSPWRSAIADFLGVMYKCASQLTRRGLDLLAIRHC